MIKSGDTLPYTEEKTIIDGETMYLGECFTFEKVGGKIINQQDDHCKSQGLWININEDGSYSTGLYKDNRRHGVWRYYDAVGELKSEMKNVSIGRDTYLVKKVTYENGAKTVIVDKKFLSFYLENLFLIMAIFFLTFFSRVFINSRIYNVENSTDYSPVYSGKGKLFNNIGHMVQCMYSFWFSNYKPENKLLVRITNTLSVIALVILFGSIIGLAIVGELN